MIKPSIDHLGNKFDSKIEMCRYWNISYTSFNKKEKRGLSLKECLEKKDYTVYDHLGNKFNNITEKCNFYGISTYVYNDRIKKGLSEKEALTNPIRITKIEKCTDHLGNEFNNFTEMCKYYGMKNNTVKKRIDNNVPLKIALTEKSTIIHKKIYVTYKNVNYYSRNELCNSLRIPENRFVNFLKKFKNNKIKAIDYCIKFQNTYKYEDHLGNKFKSIAKMCEKYNVNPTTYSQRIANKWSVKEALLGKETKLITDIFNNNFLTFKEACKYYNQDYMKFNYLNTREELLSVSLGIIPYISKQHQNFIFRENFEIKNKQYDGINNKSYWLCIINNEKMILPKDEIYKRMEAIVIEEFNNGTFKLPNQTTEKSGN